MKNIRKLIPKGIIPSRKTIIKMFNERDRNEEDSCKREAEYNKQHVEKVKHKVTEASWKKTINKVNKHKG